MGWKRTKAETTILSPEPSMMWWSLSGILMLIAGVLLFMLHSAGTLKILSELNIWQVSLTPPLLWFLLFCLRGWLWGREVDKHQFLEKEAAHAQKEWETWAERHLAIIGSCVFLPDKISVACLHDQLQQYFGLTRRINYLPGDNAPEFQALTELVRGIAVALQRLPPELPLKVTLVTDLSTDNLTETFSRIWTKFFPERSVPDSITVTNMLSMDQVEERLKQPVLTVDLLLVMQLRGGDTYSDGLAALLMTSDDVAQKYHLAHPARLLRPMPLDMQAFATDFTLFLDTQTVACRTERVLADSRSWEDVSASVMTIGAEHGTTWRPSERMSLEKWCGKPGPAAPWLLTAFTADLVSIRQASCLTLFSSGEEHFISTVTTGSEDEHIG
jgi:hypothetical protein